MSYSKEIIFHGGPARNGFAIGDPQSCGLHPCCTTPISRTIGEALPLSRSFPLLARIDSLTLEADAHVLRRLEGKLFRSYECNLHGGTSLL